MAVDVLEEEFGSEAEGVVEVEEVADTEVVGLKVEEIEEVSEVVNGAAYSVVWLL